MYNASTDVYVKAIEPNKRIFVEWTSNGGRTTIEWIFVARPDDTTFVTITNTGFHGTEREIGEQAVAATEGFTFVLAGLKAYLNTTLC